MMCTPKFTPPSSLHPPFTDKSTNCMCSYKNNNISFCVFRNMKPLQPEKNLFILTGGIISLPEVPDNSSLMTPATKQLTLAASCLLNRISTFPFISFLQKLIRGSLSVSVISAQSTKCDFRRLRANSGISLSAVIRELCCYLCWIFV